MVLDRNIAKDSTTTYAFYLHIYPIRGFFLDLVHCKGKADSVDDAVAAVHVHREVRVRPKGLFPNDGVIDKVLAHGISVLKRASHRGEVTTDIGRGDLSRDNLHLDGVGVEGTTERFVRLHGTVDRSEDSERTGSSEFSSDTGGLKGTEEFYIKTTIQRWCE